MSSVHVYCVFSLIGLIAFAGKPARAGLDDALQAPPAHAVAKARFPGDSLDGPDPLSSFEKLILTGGLGTHFASYLDQSSFVQVVSTSKSIRAELLSNGAVHYLRRKSPNIQRPVNLLTFRQFKRRSHLLITDAVAIYLRTQGEFLRFCHHPEAARFSQIRIKFGFVPNDLTAGHWSQLQYLKNLKTLNLTDNHLNAMGAVAFSESLIYLPQLKHLNLMVNHIEDAGLIALSQALRFTPRLESLDLDCNQIGDLGIITLSQNLIHTPKLTVLDLNLNDFGDEGAIALGAMLHRVPRLKQLQVMHNDLREPGGVGLAKGLEHLTELRFLNVSNNSLRTAGLEAISGTFKKMPHLMLLDLGANELDDAAAVPLAENLKFLPELQGLNISGNELTDLGLVRIIRSLKDLKKLKRFQLIDHELDQEGALALAELALTQPELEILY
jgi:Ran GTPase-activating protein (RanGAP) involved in mRNA processing and transport